jgi:Flp pilus assembly protein TadB
MAHAGDRKASNRPRAAAREVRLDDAVQARLREQMEQERTARARNRMLRRFVLLPSVLAGVFASLTMTIYGDTTASIVGNLIATGLLWFLWKVRRRLPSLFGFS